MRKKAGEIKIEIRYIFQFCLHEQIKERYMALGIIEIILITSIWTFTAICHLIAFLVMKTNNQKLPKKIFIIYGIPASFKIGSVLSPPDLLSSIIIAVLCLILYAAICGCSFFLINHLAMNRFKK